MEEDNKYIYLVRADSMESQEVFAVEKTLGNARKACKQCLDDGIDYMNLKIDKWEVGGEFLKEFDAFSPSKKRHKK